MKYLPLILLGLFSLSAFSQEDDSASLKTIIKDTGAKERVDVKALEDCKSVMAEQQRLMQMIRPEYKQKVTLKDVSVLEVF